LVVLNLPLCDVYGDHWSTTGQATPDAASADSAVYLPGRNALLLVKPALWCQMNGIAELAIGVLESNPFGDASAEFFAGFEAAINRGAPAKVHIARPLAAMNKRQVMELGRGLPLELTFSCISPVSAVHCGRCNKCAERQAAFRRVGQPDPTSYAAAAVLAGGVPSTSLDND
jgi:7-cyano-7-deazaguanine synthase